MNEWYENLKERILETIEIHQTRKNPPMIFIPESSHNKVMDLLRSDEDLSSEKHEVNGQLINVLISKNIPDGQVWIINTPLLDPNVHFIEDEFTIEDFDTFRKLYYSFCKRPKVLKAGRYAHAMIATYAKQYYLFKHTKDWSEEFFYGVRVELDETLPEKAYKLE